MHKRDKIFSFFHNVQHNEEYILMAYGVLYLPSSTFYETDLLQPGSAKVYPTTCLQVLELRLYKKTKINNRHSVLSLNNSRFSF